MPTKYGTLRQRQNLERKVKSMDTIEKDPYLHGGLPDKNQFRRRKEELTKQLQSISPPPTTGEDKDSLQKRQENIEAFLKLPCPSIKKPEMPTKSEMWDSTAQTRGKHSSWEWFAKNYTLDTKGEPVKAKGGYGALMEWKDNQRRLHGDEEEINIDIANTENLRSEKQNMGLVDSTRMTYGLSAKAKENYDAVFSDHEKTEIEKRLEEAQRRIDDLERTSLKRTRAIPKDRIQCSAVRTNGQRCNMYVKKGETLCRMHKEDDEVQLSA